jgi:sulfur-oxidizing protein SoxY
MKRRSLLAASLAIACRPARATPEAMAEAIRRFTGGVATRPGRVQLDIAPLVENGNAVPVKLSVDSPMTPSQHVSAIALFTPRNPQPDVAIFRLGPRAGQAIVATRMRLATSQTIVAIAQLNDGSFWQTDVAVEVTLAACVEGS